MIGSYLIDLIMTANELYNCSIHVFALVRNKEKAHKRFQNYETSEYYKLIVHDVTQDLSKSEIGSIDYIIHAASNTHPKEYSSDPVGTITANVIGMHNIYEYVRNYCPKCRVVCLSSVEIYGENNNNIDQFTEEDYGYINSNTLRAGYPESKRLCETMSQAYHKQFGIDYVIPRLSRIYGSTIESDDSKALTQFLRNAVAGKNIVLKSKGDQVFSYTYIADAANAILTIMVKGDSGEAYNVAAPIDNMCLKDIVTYLAKIVNVNVVFEIPEKNEAVGYSTATRAVLNIDKISRELGWKPSHDLKTGLDKTISMLKAAEND